MKASWMLAMVAAVATMVPGEALPAARDQGYNLVGEIRIQSVQPTNPLGRDVFRRRVFVRLRTDGRHPQIELQLKGDPQKCVFRLEKLRHGFEIGSTDACAFKAGGFGGRVWLPRGMAVVQKDRLSFEGLAVVEWMGHKGQAGFRFEGPRDRTLETR